MGSFSNLYYEAYLNVYDRIYYDVSNNTPSWVYNSYSYWTMNRFEDDRNSVIVISNSGFLSNSHARDNRYYLRPVINLSKCALGDTDKLCSCTKKYRSEMVTKYKEYKVGDEIEYNGNIYKVLKDSNQDNGYVYISNLTSKYGTDNQVEYYTSDTCNNAINETGCTSDYAASIVKKLIDNWIDSELNIDDLVEIDNYKARLITGNELIQQLGFEYVDNSRFAGYYTTKDTPEWVKECSYNISYWIMEGYEDYNTYVHKFDGNNYVYKDKVYEYGYIKPVINLKKSVLGDNLEYKIGDEVEYLGEKYHIIEDSDNSKNYVTIWKCGVLGNNLIDKCQLDGGCWQEEIQVENGCEEDDEIKNNSKVSNDNNSVTVENTLKVVSNVVLIISFALMFIGMLIIGYNYYVMKKSKK